MIKLGEKNILYETMNPNIETGLKLENTQELQSFLEALCLSRGGETESHSEDNINNKGNFLYKLKHLNVSCTDLIEIPIKICQLKYLTELNLSNNLLSSLPNELGNLHNLVTLQLSKNKLNCLPKSLRYIQQLNCLDISHNKFFEVPDVLFYGLRVLKILDLSHNIVSSFSDPPACINKLVMLSLCHNKLNQIPTWIFDSICHLQILDLSENQIFFDSGLVNLYGNGISESLRLLNIENCKYNCANNDFVSVLKNLEVLQLSNKINLNDKRIGKNYCGNLTMNVFKNLIYIKYLYLQNVQIATLPSDFDCLKNIHTLDLCMNLLSWLPECFCNLTSLRRLNLTSNQLLFLPKNIGNLVNLQQIHLGNNKLYKIPESFYSLVNLEYVDFYNNNIEEIKEKIFKEGNLKGIDLGLNCVNFSGFEYDADMSENTSLYDCLKNSFRKSFGFLDCRSDMQKTGLHKTSGGSSSDLTKFGSMYSSNSGESEQDSDVEDHSVGAGNLNYGNDLEIEDWEKSPCEIEEDELFDPNAVVECQPRRSAWTSEFQKNYCPANYHVPSLMTTYVRNFTSALKKDLVEEGQFDSD